jgi:pimeloyl-ACP methyl ester carboxylesterase
MFRQNYFIRLKQRVQAHWALQRCHKLLSSNAPASTAPKAESSVVPSSRRRSLIASKGFLVGAALATGLLVAGITVYTRPTWVLDRVERMHLKMSGAESYTVMVDGHRIHYYVSGPGGGEPVVLLHGLGGRSEDWMKLTPYLQRAGYRVYTPDLLGFGQSEEPHNSSYSISDQADMIVGFMNTVGLERVDLGGWSMGGWIAQKIAVDNPDRVRRLILMDSAGLKVPPRWDLSLFTPTTPAQVDHLHAMLMPNPPAMPRFVVQDMLRLSANYGWVVKRALASMMTAKDVMDDDLPSLKMPVLILWGDQDRITPLSEGYTMHALIPQSFLRVAYGCGHIAPASCTAQFGPELTGFLKSVYATPDRQTILRANYELQKQQADEAAGE